MNNKAGTLILAGLLGCGSMLSLAADWGTFLKAQAVLGQVEQIVDKYQDVQQLLDQGEIELLLAEPRADADGKFVFPFSSDGNITEWAEKAISAQAGAQVGAVAGEKAAGALASKVPFGGLAAGALKGKSKELAAVTAVGGWDFIRESSDLSFDKQDDFSVYMHARFAGQADYENALAAAMAIYPDMEKNHRKAVDKAYKDARKAAARKK